MKSPVNVKDRVMDISVNLARVANWAADSYEQKEKLINFFLEQTEAVLLIDKKGRQFRTVHRAEDLRVRKDAEKRNLAFGLKRLRDKFDGAQ